MPQRHELAQIAVAFHVRRQQYHRYNGGREIPRLRADKNLRPSARNDSFMHRNI